MPDNAPAGGSPGYVMRVAGLVQRSAAQLRRPASHPRAALAARRLGRQSILLVATGGLAITALMYLVDAYEITLMPPRGTPGLWPVRILTDFGKDANVVALLVVTLVAVALVTPALQGSLRLHLLRLGLNLEFFLAAVVLPLLAGELIKWIVGRGRPFVGGHANPFNFVPFAGTEAYASFPSAHAVTSVALAFAVSAAWPRARGVMIIYAVVIAGTRLVLLAHHPSDVVGGALIGLVGAMWVRYWFAVRRLGFAIRDDGAIAPLGISYGPGIEPRKGVAREASTP
ncbi:MAG TPA: phosphatase PAP2 family protein [Bradyrhizobium sp.]|nr:phosphatase PAP2 family protein [Bradyrhizobium sp.]